MTTRSKRPTLSTVAEKCGYSVNTVSRALRGDDRLPEATIQKIRQAADEVGYIPNVLASSLRSSDTHTIAIIIEDIENPHYSHLMSRIDLELRARGYSGIILCNNKSLTSEHQLAALSISYNVDGVLLFPQTSSNSSSGSLSAVRLLQRNHIPYVLVDRSILMHDTDCVRVDDEEGGYLAGKILSEMGHRKFLYIMGPENNSSQILRQKGLLRAIDEYCGSGTSNKNIRFMNESVYLTAQEQGNLYYLLTPLDYTALVCFNDECAYYCMQALQVNGCRIPEDVSLIGFDSIATDSRFLPKLSSIAHKRGHSLAKVTVEAIMKRIKNPAGDYGNVILPVDYYDGGTCGRPRK